MRNVKMLALILSAGAAASSSLHAGAILQLYSERVRPDENGAALPPIGYYNPADPSLVYSNKTVTPLVQHNGHDDLKVANSALYQSSGAVNKGRVLSVCATAPCGSTGEDNGHSAAQASGHADTQNLRVGGYVSAENYGAAPGALATSDASVTRKFRVTSGSSGLADGTVVDLNWYYHLEGSSAVSGRSYPDLTSAISSVSSNASIRRLFGVGEGDDILAGVDYGLDLSLSHMLPPVGSDDGGSLTGYQSWSAYGNTGFYQSAYERYDEVFPSGSSIGKTVNVDSRTGMLGLDYVPFYAVVGEWMEIDLNLHLFSSASGGASAFGPLEYGAAYNDYFNTLKSTLDVGGAYQGMGLGLEFEGAAESEAPEPGTTWIAGLGLTALGLGLRRRGRRQEREVRS